MTTRLSAKQRVRVIVTVATALVISMAIAAFTLRGSPPTAVATTRAAAGDVEETVIASGTLEASQMVSVGAQVSGQIKSLKVRLGDEVKAGALIAEIDSTTQENTVRNARAALVSVRALRAVQVAALKQADLAFERQKMMLTQEATSRADYEAAEATLVTTRAQIEALDAQILQAQTTLDTARANLGYTRITAPMNGTVVAVVAKEGQTVNAVQAAPTIIKLAKLDTMLVSAEIAEADIVRVRPGQKVYFTIFGNPQQRHYGTLRTVELAPASIESDTSLAANGEPSSGNSGSSQAVYYRAQFEVPNRARELRISMTAQVYVVLREAKHTLTIPSTALGDRASDGHYAVKVIDPQGRPQRRVITVGLNDNANAQVLAGLKAGEEVVVGEALGADDVQRPRLRVRMF